MKAPEIEKIIANENERREQQVRDRAREIIHAITKEQAEIVRRNEAIAELRKELQTIAVSLVASLARQEAGGYNGMAITPSADTVKALEAFLVLYRADINSVLGIETE